MDPDGGRPLRALRGFAVAVSALGVAVAAAWLLQKTVSAGWLVEARGWPAAWTPIRENLAFALDGDTWPLWLVPALAGLTLVALPLLLGRRTPGLEELRSGIGRRAADAAGLAAAAVLGAGSSLALALWLGASQRMLQYHWILVTQHPGVTSYVEGPGRWTVSMYGGAPVAALALGIGAVLAAAPWLLAARHRPLRVAGPVAAVVVALAPLAIARVPVTLAADGALGPYCEERCNELDRQHAGLTLRPWQLPGVMDHDRRCGISLDLKEGEILRLPRVEVRACPEVAVTVRVARDRIEIDGIRHGALVAGRFPAEPAVDDALRGVLYDALAEKADEARAVAERNPVTPFEGRYLVLADADTPMATVDELRRIAFQAEFDDPLFVVALPEHHEPPWIRAMRIDPRDPSAGIWTLEGAEWTLLIDRDEARLVSPDGRHDLLAHGPEELAALAGPLRVALGGVTHLAIVTHHPDVTLQEELSYRAALTRDAGFSATYTADPPALDAGGGP